MGNIVSEPNINRTLKARMGNLSNADEFAKKVYIEYLAACEIAKVSNKAAARFLNEKGCRTRLGSEWNHVAVKRIYSRVEKMGSFRQYAFQQVIANSHVKLIT